MCLTRKDLKFLLSLLQNPTLFFLSKIVVKRDVKYASLYVCLKDESKEIKHLLDHMLREKDHCLFTFL